METTKIDNLEFEDIDTKDYPDFCNAYISAADLNGIEMTEEQLDELNDDRDFVYEKLMDHLY